MNLVQHIPRRLSAVVLAAALAVPSVISAEELTTGTGESGSGSGVTSKEWKKSGENSWTMDSDGDGAVDVTLSRTVNDDGNEEWTYTFSVLGEDEYSVYEEMTGTDGKVLADGYTSSGSDGKEAVPYDYGTTDGQTYTIVNEYNDYKPKEYGTISVKVVVEDTSTMKDKNDTFTFTITLSGDTDDLKSSIEGLKVFGDTVFTDGKATVSLKANESLTIPQLPAGITYTVTGSDSTFYKEVSRSGDTGTVSADNTSQAVFTYESTYTPPAAADTTSFKLELDVEDAANLSGDTEFGYSVLFEKLDPGTTITATNGTDTVTVTSDPDTGMAVVPDLKLKDGDVWTFTGVPVGSTYQVQQEAGDFTPSYNVTNSGSGGSIAKSADSAGKNENLATGKETAEKDEDVTIRFTNTIDRYQNIVLEKKSNNADGTPNEEDDTQYGITVTFTGLKAGSRITTSNGILIADDDGTAETTMLISPDETITFYDIPVGTKYRFTEEKNDKISSYAITGDNLNVLSASGANTDFQTPLSTGKADATGLITDEVVDANENAIVTFTSTKPSTAKLIVTDYSGTASSGGKKVGGAEYAIYTSEGIEVNYTTDKDGNPSNIIVINSDGSSDKLESDLFVAGDYYLVETKAPDGHFVNDKQLSFSITKDDLGKTINIKAYDDELITLPVTGGEGRYIVYAVAGAAIAAGVVFMIIAGKKKRA